MIGRDHDRSDTYYGDAAKYYGREETDLLAGAPDWWRGGRLEPLLGHDWLGSVYGWDGTRWLRADDQAVDGFESEGLLQACSLEGLREVAAHGPHSDMHALPALVSADADLSGALLRAVVGDMDAGAGRQFLLNGGR